MPRAERCGERRHGIGFSGGKMDIDAGLEDGASEGGDVHGLGDTVNSSWDLNGAPRRAVG